MDWNLNIYINFSFSIISIYLIIHVHIVLLTICMFTFCETCTLHLKNSVQKYQKIDAFFKNSKSFDLILNCLHLKNHFKALHFTYNEFCLDQSICLLSFSIKFRSDLIHLIKCKLQAHLNLEIFLKFCTQC